MTRKHYVATAEALRSAFEYRPSGGTERERQAWRNGFHEAVDAIADTFAGDNDRFSRERFYRACGLS